jgi:cell division septation protein DedD
MQAYANVGTAPTRHVAKASGKVYWEFRASESARGEDKNPTWYTVRVFKDEDPKLNKGDFVVFTGKLKNDVFMGRDGKPMGVLTVLAFNLQKVAKDGKRETLVDTPQTAETVASATKAPKEAVAPPSAPAPTATTTEAAPPAKPLFGSFGSSWGMTLQAMRLGA